MCVGAYAFSYLPCVCVGVLCCAVRCCQLVSSLSENEKMRVRLREVMQQKISDFRDDCKTITGFNIERRKDIYRLRSM
jgi:hypothetical protein